MIRKWILWPLFAIFATFCIVWLTILVVNAVKNDSMRRGVKELRTERAAKGAGPIYIGAAGGWSGNDYRPILNGINLAAEEINKAGGVLGRQIKIIPKDDNVSVMTGMKVAQELADNIDVVAVIGHPTSTVSLATATMYEYYGLLVLSPLATNPKLTKQGHQLFFRNIPTDILWGEQLADLAKRRGYKKVAIYYFQDDYSRELANVFERRCDELGIEIADRRHYDATYKEPNFSSDFSLWKNQFKLDAILLAGFLPKAAECIIQMRTAGLTIPILSGEALDDEELIRVAGKAAENTIVESSFDTNVDRPDVIAFNIAFKAQYGILPNAGAAQGYDAVKLLAHVIQKGQSTVPVKMAETLRTVKEWQGVTGPHTFDTYGDVSGKTLLMKIVKEGRFQLIEQPNSTKNRTIK